MRFVPTELAGCFLIELDPQEDERGSFARTYCHDTFEQLGLHAQFIQSSISSNPRCGTLRGMHYQIAPCEEVKIIHCVRGAIYDVVLDVRRDSITFGQWIAHELSPDSQRLLYIPAGCAHGFQTLQDQTDILYHISAPHSPRHARGVRWNDPAFTIQWPIDNPIMNERDRTYPDFAIGRAASRTPSPSGRGAGVRVRRKRLPNVGGNS